MQCHHHVLSDREIQAGHTQICPQKGSATPRIYDRRYSEDSSHNINMILRDNERDGRDFIRWGEM